MNLAQDHSTLYENLANLREQSLVLIASFAGMFGYAWFLWTSWAQPTGPAQAAAWLGIGLLILGATGSYALKGTHLRIATHLLVWIVWGASACAILAFATPELAYLFILPIVFASVLLSQPAHLVVAIASALLILIVAVVRVGIPLPPTGLPFPLVIGALVSRLLSRDVGLPAAIIALVTIASSISTRNLHTALAWALYSYGHARRNEELARERQGELRRALKALDEASHRLERANYMLALARDQAEETRRLKQQFAQNISHELRTPLNLIVGFTELMTESPEYYGGQLEPAYLRDLNIVHRNASHLLDLVNDVLDLARIGAAQMSLSPEKTDPASLVQEAVTTARSLVEAHGLALFTEIEADLAHLWIDPIRIRQVLFNLLNNAARFTLEGSVTVSAHQQGEEVIFAVADTGVGIAPKDIPHIFEEFRQADGSLRRRQGGAGLGLAISQRFVALHGGRMWVESQLGQGSIFYFSLPVSRADAAAAPGSYLAEEPLSTIRERGEPVLLAVTHSPAAAALLTRYVRGFRTVVVPDLEHARETARQVMPQAVVIDRAGGSLNSEKLEDIVREWELPHVPFVACPLPGGELPQRQAVDGYLVKPVSRQSLGDILHQFGQDVDKVLVVDDDQDFVLLMGRLLESNPVWPYQVVSAYSGQEGLAMLDHHRPDLIFLDLGLPDIDGTPVMEHMRSTSRGRHVPIVAVSNQDEVSGQATMTGATLIAKADGMMLGEVVQWVQNVIDTAITPLPAPQAPTAGPVR